MNSGFLYISNPYIIWVECSQIVLVIYGQKHILRGSRHCAVSPSYESLHKYHVNINLFLLNRPEDGMICLSRSDKNPFEIDGMRKDRSNFNAFNITNGKLYCLGEGEVYELEDLCNVSGPIQLCTMKNGKIMQLNYG